MKFIPLLFVINYKLHIALNIFETAYLKMINIWVHLDLKKKTLNKHAHYFLLKIFNFEDIRAQLSYSKF